MLSVILGLSGAVVYGVSDFFGGLGARHLGALRLTWLSVVAGLLSTVIAFQLSSGDWAGITPETLLWGGLSGVSGSLGIMFLYASLAIGPMSIVSPLGAVVAATIPVLWEVAIGKLLSPLGYVAIVIALIAVFMVGFVKAEGAIRVRPQGIVFAVLAGVGIGGYLICMSRTAGDSGISPFVANRVVAFSVLTLVVCVAWLISQARTRGWFRSAGAASVDLLAGDKITTNWRRGLIFALVCGVLDTLGNVLILSGFRLGTLSVVGVLSALYPAGTIVLAALVLKEKIGRVQLAGMILALAAAALLSLS